MIEMEREKKKRLGDIMLKRVRHNDIEKDRERLRDKKIDREIKRKKERVGDLQIKRVSNTDIEMKGEVIERDIKEKEEREREIDRKIDR